MDHHDWQRGRSKGHRHYDDDDEAQPVYIGVPVSHRRKRRRHHSYASDADRDTRHTHYDHHTHREHSHQGYYHDREEHYGDDEGSTERREHADPSVSPAAERLRHLLAEDDTTPTPTIFTEMDTLQQEGGELEWKESARWVKFEEKVEEGGERWSKPHVSTLTLHSLFELRTCLQTGSILLDLEGYSLPQIVDEIVDRQIADGLIPPDLKEKISFVLLRKHRHQTKKPIHRSLADIGKSSNTASNRSPQVNHSTSSASGIHRSTEDLRSRQSSSLSHLPHKEPTRPDRGWLVMPFGKNPWWWYLASSVPALLVTILIFMDQQISAVIVNRKENKLKKGCGYHLDLFWVGVLMAVCSFLGLPWYVAATVISIAHIDSLKMESESSAPGEQPQFLGVREQRLTGILVFVMTGLSIFLAPVLQYIPMPVLYGVFLYMGVASLSGIQFWERMKLYLMPAKHQPDFSFLRHVPLRRVHLFTIVQIVCLAVLWILKSTFLAIIFPVMILGLMLVRKLLDLIFSQHDLAWLDDILPDKDKKKKEDEKKKKKEKKAAEPESDEEEMNPYSTVTSEENELDRSITLHLKITCPPSPALSQTNLAPGIAPSPHLPTRQPVPQVSIQVESDREEPGLFSEQQRCPHPTDHLPPPGAEFHQKLHAHFGDCAETVL
ncbi:electrogenic sodium bicarbonate cotransporter 4 [Micropterus dolomieu]|uniref:electrogenic sodium bicarbonate cotransporter 4 n=1 Tax=Micropterus dolomieu TaxID=147949 RepID=UPI001E8EF44E|nr:electrogenic sodium bicarbonate cotransporter 4 [Micropterus dolomieu]